MSKHITIRPSTIKIAPRIPSKSLYLIMPMQPIERPRIINKMVVIIHIRVINNIMLCFLKIKYVKYKMYYILDYRSKVT